MDLKIDKKYINSIRLVQVEFFDYDCLEINKKFILKKIDDILFCYPNSGNCEKKLSDEIKKVKLSSYTLNLDTINIDKTSLILIGMIFVFINIFFIAGIINYKKEYKNILKKEQSLYQYNLPLNSYQLDAIYSNLKEIDKTQKAIRKDLEIFSSTPLKKNEEFITLIFNNPIYSLEINSSKNFNNYFSKYFIIKSSSSNKIYKAIVEDRNLNE